MLVTENDTVLFESDAIVEYLDDKYAPNEEVTAEQKALDRAWSYQASKHYMHHNAERWEAKNKTFLKHVWLIFKKAFLKAENKLGDTQFFKGDYISNVDAKLGCHYYRASVIKIVQVLMLEGFPKVQAWQTALIKSGLTEKTLPQDFVEKFSGFLFNEYLFGKPCGSSLILYSLF
ncbi:glutathione S-transferase family protein [Vibrio chagasii]|nr:glutathione S-transferase family protein [Vibrio chagasii]